jgi:hypothetical protein
MLPQTKHTNQPTTMSIKQWSKNWSLSLYGIDDNMHPQKKILKYHMEMWLKNLNISIGNPCTMNN